MLKLTALGVGHGDATLLQVFARRDLTIWDNYVVLLSESLLRRYDAARFQ